MRILVAASLAGALMALAPVCGAAFAQEALDARPLAWRGVQFGAEQVFEGDYTVDYDTSAFVPAAAAPQQALWLAGWEDRPGDDGGITRRYHLRFVGRETVEPGRYGALGAYRNEVLISRLISSRLLIEKPEPDPKPAAQPAPAPKPKAKPKARRRLKKR